MKGKEKTATHKKKSSGEEGGRGGIISRGFIEELSELKCKDRQFLGIKT